MTTPASQPAVRISRATRGDLHDAYVLPSGRVYYRHNCGKAEPVIPRKAGALRDLAACVSLNLDLALEVARAEGQAQWKPFWKLKERVKQFNCTANSIRVLSQEAQ